MPWTREDVDFRHAFCAQWKTKPLHVPTMVLTIIEWGCITECEQIWKVYVWGPCLAKFRAGTPQRPPLTSGQKTHARRLLELGRRVPFFGSQREKSVPAKWSHSPKTYSDGKKPSPVLFLLPSNWVNDYATEYSQMQNKSHAHQSQDLLDISQNLFIDHI